MNNRYLEKIAADPLSMLAIGGGVHVAQNALAHMALKSKKFSGSVADHFHAGLLGKVSPSSSEKALTTISGAVNPEIGMIRDEAYHAGHGIRKELMQRNARLGDKASRAHVYLMHLAKGSFDKVQKGMEKYPHVVGPVVDAVENRTGYPLRKILSSPESIAYAQNAWRDPKNVLSSRIISDFANPASDRVKALSAGHSAPPTQRYGAGAMAMGALELSHGHLPVAGAINISKALMGNEKVTNAIPGANKLKNWVIDKMVLDSIKSGATKGLEGRKLHPLDHKVDVFVSSATTGHARKLANEMAYAGHLAGVTRT